LEKRGVPDEREKGGLRIVKRGGSRKNTPETACVREKEKNRFSGKGRILI